MPYQVQSIRPRGGERIELGKLTVLVGPNNCGKSQTLKDIREYSSSGSLQRLVVLESLEASLPTQVELRASVETRPHESAADHVQIIGVKDDLLTQIGFGPQSSWLDHQYNPAGNHAQQKKELLRSLGTCLIAYLGAEARFRLTSPSSGFDPRTQAPSNAIQSLLNAGEDVHAELRGAFRSAFNMDIGLDWAAMMKFYLRVSEDFGEIPNGRVALDELMRNAPDLEKQGDGYRSFAGIALALLTFPNRLLLLDEPEAFLHPAQARVLGRWLSNQAATRPAQIIIATHSSDFLAGLISSDTPATIMRLNRALETRFHRVPPETSQGLVQSPLLSSQPVLDSLFHRGVVVCEGDPDRAVYQTVAHRYHAQIGGEEVLFIHCNGKDAMSGPVQLLRQSGTPVCVIADFDVINSQSLIEEIVVALSGEQLSDEIRLLRNDVATSIERKPPEASLQELRKSVTQWLDDKNPDIRRARRSLVQYARAGSNKWSQVKRQGLNAIEKEGLDPALSLLEKLEALGVFVVPCGELESWINLQQPKGKVWNQRALQVLHSNECPNALKDFVKTVVERVTNAV